MCSREQVRVMERSWGLEGGLGWGEAGFHLPRHACAHAQACVHRALLIALDPSAHRNCTLCRSWRRTAATWLRA